MRSSGWTVKKNNENELTIIIIRIIIDMDLENVLKSVLKIISNKNKNVIPRILLIHFLNNCPARMNGNNERNTKKRMKISSNIIARIL